MFNLSAYSEVILITAAVVVLFALLRLILFRPTHDQNVEEWARKNKLKVLELEIIERANSPFSALTTRKSENFYKVRVLTEDQTQKDGYLCVAGQLSAFFTPGVSVIWNDKKV